MSNIPKQRKQGPGLHQVTRVEHHQVRSGPLPDAAEMARYEEIMPGAAERIMRMAEIEQQYEHRHGNRVHVLMVLGTVCGVVLALLGIGLAYYMVYTRTDGIDRVVIALTGLIGVALIGRAWAKRARRP